MTTENLAFLGGPKSITKPFRRYNPIGSEEVKAVQAVIETGVLSQYLGRWHADRLVKANHFETRCSHREEVIVLFVVVIEELPAIGLFRIADFPFHVGNHFLL